MINLTLPDSFTFVSASGECVFVSDAVTCTAENINPGDVLQLSVLVLPTTGGITVSSTASIEGNVNDPNAGDNTSTETTNIVSGGGKGH